MDIVEELRQNREAGARRLESEYKVGLVSFARRLCANPSDAEELVNRTFAAVIEGIDDYLEQSAFFGWMCKIMMNINAADHRRRADRDVVYPGDLPDVADDDALESITRHLDASLVRDAIETLPKKMKEAIVMHYLMEQPVGRVAKVLALPVSTVKWRLHCAREVLAAPRQNDGDDALRRQLRHRRNRRQSGRMLHCGIQCLRQQGALPLFERDGHHDVLLPVRPQPLG